MSQVKVSLFNLFYDKSLHVFLVEYTPKLKRDDKNEPLTVYIISYDKAEEEAWKAEYVYYLGAKMPGLSCHFSGL